MDRNLDVDTDGALAAVLHDTAAETMLNVNDAETAGGQSEPDSAQKIFWPKDPYKGLANYEFEDERLFAGRDAEIHACAELLSNSQTKLLILHGQTGCGKSSFLRAGLIPALERNGAGYLFLRRESTIVPGLRRPSFIRCGDDPLARIAEEIFQYTAQPLSVQTASGMRAIDFGAARLGEVELQAFVHKCREPHQLFLSLDALAEAIPHTLVLILDQVEEIFTLNPQETANRGRFSDFIKEIANSDIDMRFLIAIRKDHSGQLIDLIQVGNAITAAFRTFFLADMSHDGIRQAILRPTERQLPGELLKNAPYGHYHFEFAPGVVDYIIKKLNELVPAGATLPVMQIVCRGLYEQARKEHAPFIISMIFDPAGSEIRNRIESHVIHSLRGVLLHEQGRSTVETELKWLSVLRQLVREEGDGRVHTDVVTRSILEENARKADITGPIAPIIDRLTDPGILILRRVALLSPNVSSDAELFCLGHDMVGIALIEALRVAKARQITRGRMRTGILISITLVLLTGSIGIAAVRHSAARTQQVSELLDVSNRAQASDVLDALATAKRAQLLGEGGLSSDERPNAALAGLLAGLPVTMTVTQGTAPLAIDAVYPTYALNERIGFANLSNHGVVEVLRWDGSQVQKQRFSAPSPLKTSDGKPAIAQLDVLDITPSLFVALYRPSRPLSGEPKAQGGVVAFSSTLGTKQFAQRDLVAALGPITKITEGLELYGMSGNSIMLYGFSADQRSMQIRSLRISSSLVLTPDISREINVTTPAMPLNGHQVVSYIYADDGETAEGSAEPVKTTPGVPTAPLTRVEATDIWGKSKPTVWDVTSLASVKKCREKPSQWQSCEVSAVPDMQKTGLLGLGLWERTNGRFGTYPRGYVSTLIIIDLSAPHPIEVDLRLATEVRRNCAVPNAIRQAKLSEQAANRALNDDDLPVFMVKARNGILIGYASRTSAQLINVSNSDMTCSEVFYPESQIDNWRANEDGTKLLASTRTGGLVWNLLPTADTTPTAIANRIERGCNGEFQQYVTGKETATIAKRKQLVQTLCSGTLKQNHARNGDQNE